MSGQEVLEFPVVPRELLVRCIREAQERHGADRSTAAAPHGR